MGRFNGLRCSRLCCCLSAPRYPLSSSAYPEKNRTEENRILAESFTPTNCLANTEEIGGLLSLFTYVRKVHKTLKASNRKAIPEKCLNGKTIEFPHLSVSTLPLDLLSNIFAFPLVRFWNWKLKPWHILMFVVVVMTQTTKNSFPWNSLIFMMSRKKFMKPEGAECKMLQKKASEPKSCGKWEKFIMVKSSTMNWTVALAHQTKSLPNNSIFGQKNSLKISTRIF